MVGNAYIHLWDQRVGAISWNEDTGMAAFEFDDAFIRTGLDIAPITMPISRGNRIYEFPETRNTATFRGLPGLLADVLPDRYGNALINAWLTRQGRPTDSLNPVELLCFIGKRGMGALEFEPVQPVQRDTASPVELNELIAVAEQILSGRQDFSSHLTEENEKSLIDILRVGTSAGGARAKAVISWNAKTGEVRSGQASAPKGFSQWLIKFDGVTDTQFGASSGYGRVEMAYHHMAIAAGIHMTECRLLEENGRAHFMTRRFDRPDNGEKLHVQTLCAMRHFDFNEVNQYSYEQLFETMRMLALPYPDAQELYRRMCFNVMARNCDDHTKNFAFTMDQTGEWKLSPAYDVCHAYRPDSGWVSQHALSINGKRKEFTREDLLTIGHSMNIRNAKEIIADVVEACSKWMDFAEEMKVEGKLRDAIRQSHWIL